MTRKFRHQTGVAAHLLYSFTLTETNSTFSEGDAEKKRDWKTFRVVLDEIKVHCLEAVTQEPRAHGEKGKMKSISLFFFALGSLCCPVAVCLDVWL